MCIGCLVNNKFLTHISRQGVPAPPYIYIREELSRGERSAARESVPSWWRWLDPFLPINLEIWTSFHRGCFNGIGTR